MCPYFVMLKLKQPVLVCENLLCVLILQFINYIDLEMKFHAKFAQSANRYDTFFMCESDTYEAS
jgi:hypothetical protein